MPPVRQRVVTAFWVTLARRTHPFPSRTRKLSSSAPMVLHRQLCGRVGSRPVYIKALQFGGLFYFYPTPNRDIVRTIMQSLSRRQFALLGASPFILRGQSAPLRARVKI